MIQKEVKVDLEAQGKDKHVPIWHKLNLTVEEAALYSNIGENKIRELINQPECDFIIAKGTQKIIKRKRFEEYLDKIQVI